MAPPNDFTMACSRCIALPVAPSDTSPFSAGSISLQQVPGEQLMQALLWIGSASTSRLKIVCGRRQYCLGTIPYSCCRAYLNNAAGLNQMEARDICWEQLPTWMRSEEATLDTPMPCCAESALNCQHACCLSSIMTYE